jgi:hypothetical protein
MQPQHAIEPPRRAGGYPGRDADCLAALRPSVTDLAIASTDALCAVMAGGMPGDFAELARRAEGAGWQRGEAEAAIRHLAREQEGARGTIFD